MDFDILAFGAHPDDIEIFCSGTLHKAIKKGLKVAVIDLTKAELSTRGNVTLREQETRKSNEILGLNHRDCLNIPDGGVQINEENKIKVIKSIRKYRPKIVLIPYSECRHPDHRNTGLLVKDAFFFAGLEKIKTEVDGISQQEYRPKSYFQFMEIIDFNPTFVVDISDEFETKMKSIKAFKSKFFDEQNMDKETFISKKSFLDFVEAKARYYGQKIGVTYGEPFYSHLPLNLRDFNMIL
jgi:N-acetylglucosamine malate deacetylase 1